MLLGSGKSLRTGAAPPRSRRLQFPLHPLLERWAGLEHWTPRQWLRIPEQRSATPPTSPSISSWIAASACITAARHTPPRSRRLFVVNCMEPVHGASASDWSSLGVTFLCRVNALERPPPSSWPNQDGRLRHASGWRRRPCDPDQRPFDRRPRTVERPSPCNRLADFRRRRQRDLPPSRKLLNCIHRLAAESARPLLSISDFSWPQARMSQPLRVVRIRARRSLAAVEDGGEAGRWSSGQAS